MNTDQSQPNQPQTQDPIQAQSDFQSQTNPPQTNSDQGSKIEPSTQSNVGSSSVEPSVENQADSEKLIDQNIFFLLGVDDGSDEEKDRFLDELQQVIWEDFVQRDLELLVTIEEKEEVDQILNDANLSELEKQEKVLVKLEKVIPDLEEIMLEKAVELKQDLVKERLASMRQFYSDNPEFVQQVNQANSLFSQGKWRSGAELLNKLVQPAKTQ
ncbi:MAG: hypothetical protein GF381_02640 [Candidatus Pacebacteria bacterium]|nr:hypothetical protein [Candidatus Paceibacterota bacterium]